MAKRARIADDPAGPILFPARTRLIYCGDPGAPGEQLQKLPGGSVDLITMDPPFHSHRNYEVFWGETKEPARNKFVVRALARSEDGRKAALQTQRCSHGETKEKRAFQDQHESTQATIEFMRPRSVELTRVLKTTGSFHEVVHQS